MTGLRVQALSASEVDIIGPETLSQWREKHRLPVPGHQYTPRFKRRQWDGTWTPGSWVRQRGDEFELRCSRGLLPRVVRDLGGTVEFQTVTDEEIARFFASIPDRAAKLRDYQRRAIELGLKEGWGRIAFATNAGKGAVIALLAAFAEQRGEPALILCDELAVFDALKGELAQWGKLRPALVQSGIKVPPHDLVSLAMVPTLARRLADDKTKTWIQWLVKHRMVLLDEADKADADTWRLILKGAKNSVFRLGFSGSFKEDLYHELRMDTIMGPVLDRVKNKEMVERGVSAKPSIEIHAYDATHALTPFPKEWWQLQGAQRRNLVYERTIVYNQQRHQFIASLVQPDTPTAIIINRVDHGKDLAGTIPGAVFLDGSVSEGERVRVLDEFREGRVHVLVVTKILDRGTNRLGHAADLIFASGEGSPSQVLQRIGRGLRRAGGKEFLRLVDVVDRVHTEGADKRLKTAASFLHNAARRRLQVYAHEQFDIQIVPNR